MAGETHVEANGRPVVFGIAKPDARIEVVHRSEARTERYQVILPRQDGRGWRMARAEAPQGRLELIAPDLCGARGIHLSVVTMPVGMQDRPHFHVSGEKVMYIVRGRGRIVSGEDLDEVVDVEAGDAIYVPPFAVHAPANVGDDEFEFVMASNAPLDVTIPGGTLRQARTDLLEEKGGEA